MSSVRVYVDLDDVYNEMDRSDKQNMAVWLYDDGFLQTHTNPEIRKLMRSDEESFGENEFHNNLNKLWNNYHRLSNEEEDLIKKISFKF